MVFCNGDCLAIYDTDTLVTILILVDGFLQWGDKDLFLKVLKSHNPYFSRWFSAIRYNHFKKLTRAGHNPYFSRWFSAILVFSTNTIDFKVSQSLF